MKEKFKYMALTAFGLSMFFPVLLHAEDPDEWFRKAEKEYEEFVKEANDSYNSFRDKVNKEYADFMAKPWTPVKTVDPIPRPNIPEPGPTVVPEGEDPMPSVPNPVIIIETIPEPTPQPRPQPVEPIEPEPVWPGVEPIKMEVYGTYTEVPGADLSTFHIPSSNSAGFSEGWRKLSGRNTNNLINGCLKVRDQLNLPDWHYILYTDVVASALTSPDSNEHTLLMGYLLNQSGYDIRFVYEQQSGKLHLVFSSTGTFYDRPRYKLDNGWYYAYTRPQGLVSVCDFSTPGEKRMSLAIDRLPNLKFSPGKKRTVEVVKHPELVLNVTTNQNLIDFFGDYPYGALGESEDTRWSAHAQVPTSNEIKNEVYPALREAVKGLSQYDAVNLLLRVAQSFPYEYDDVVWGKDRTFFMEESWYYPYSDCEDHAINFSHLVKDILGLQTALISYPGHLSAAVAITDGSAKGDYLVHNGKQYTVCDATYFYAPAGSTASAYKNAKATLVPVK